VISTLGTYRVDQSGRHRQRSEGTDHRANAIHDVPDRLGVTRAHIENIEDGNADITVGLLAAIASALQLGIDLRLVPIKHERV
jgi:transcriptional regulator with XRE-family HTH domain